jgi:predicted AAA+ superfamily ATPase
MMETFRIYMMVGGMPQSISTLIETNNFSEVEEVKKTILDLYRSDINREDDGILMELFNSIPPMLNRVSKTFSPNVVKNGSKSGRYIKRISWLCESKMVNPCYNSTSPDPAITQFEDRGNLKLYFFDTGLLMTMMMEKNMATHEDLYRGILSGNLSMNQGMLFENMVAQMFVSTGKMLDFCLFRSDESDRIQELDFLLMDGRSMIPIEVKSSRVNPHKSIDRFVKKYGDRVGKGYIICTKNLSNDSGLTILPIYMAGLI